MGIIRYEMYRRSGQRGIKNIRELEVAIVVYLAKTAIWISYCTARLLGFILLGQLLAVTVVIVCELVVEMDVEGLQLVRTVQCYGSIVPNGEAYQVLCHFGIYTERFNIDIMYS